MSIKAMKQALEALEVRCGTHADERKPGGVIEALRTAIQQAEAKTDEPAVTPTVIKDTSDSLLSKRIGNLISTVFRYGTQNLSGVDDEINAISKEIARLESRATHPAPGVPEFSRIAKRKLTDLQEHGFAITGYAIQRGPVRGFIDGGGFVGWWQGEPDPGVPDGWKLVPIDPTAEMLQAALKVATPGALRAAWARMLAASPAQKGGE